MTCALCHTEFHRASFSRADALCACGQCYTRAELAQLTPEERTAATARALKKETP